MTSYNSFPPFNDFVSGVIFLGVVAGFVAEVCVFFRKRRGLRAFRKMYPGCLATVGDLSAADPSEPARLRVSFLDKDKTVRTFDDPKGIPDLEGHSDLLYRARDRVVVFSGPGIPGGVLLGHVVFRPKRTCISRRTADRVVIASVLLFLVEIVALILTGAILKGSLSLQGFGVWCLVLIATICLPSVYFGCCDAAGLVAPRGYPIVPSPATPSPAEEKHAESAESAEPESHAEGAESAE